MSEKIEVVVENGTQHGEGPHWDATTQCLYCVDDFVGDVKRYNPATGVDSRLHIGDNPCSLIIPRAKGGFVVTQKMQIAFVDSWERGNVTTVADISGKENLMLNDGKVDASGRLWIGSCFDGRQQGDPNKWLKNCSSLYSMDVDCTVKKHVDNISISNGMDWSDDNTVMYYIDSIPRQVWAFDYDIHKGTVSKQRTVCDWSDSAIPELGYPDGMAVDAEGKLWVACFDAGKVVRVDPQTGQVIREVKFPCEKITSCCFGGRDFADLYVTSTPFKMTPEELDRYPTAGSLFRVTGLGVKGRKANDFAG